MKRLGIYLLVFFFSMSTWATSYLPVVGNKYAAQVDSLYKFLLVASLISCILVIGGMIYFVLRYKRQGADDVTPYISHNNTLEFLWSFIPFLIFLLSFVWGWMLFNNAEKAPENAFEIHVFARKWGWDFQYKSGKMTTGEMVVPVNQPIKLIMTSSDVLHSFFIPAFRVKQDVLPDTYSTLWFEADNQGEYQVFCTEYCGMDHSRMLARIKVLSREGFEEWLADDPMKKFEGLTLAQRGELVVKEKACVACHSFTEDKRLVGPSLKGAFGAERKLTDGSTITVDEDYIRESIKNPDAKKSVGYENAVMSMIPVSDPEIMWITEYIKSNK